MLPRRTYLLISFSLVSMLMFSAETLAQDNADAARDVVFLSADGPVFVRLLLDVDGMGFRKRWREYADRVFQSLDGDGDRFLNRIEAGNLPPLLTAARPNSPQQTVWSQLDGDPEDGKVSPEEFRRFVVESLDASLSIRPFASTRTQAVALFPRLDDNRDGLLSNGEVLSGYESLRADDIDANDVIGIDELLPPQDPAAANEVQASSDATLDLPFVELKRDPATVARVSELLLTRYSPSTEGDTAPASRGLTRHQLAIDEETMTRYDKDENQQLDAEELVRLLNNPQPRVRILVDLRVRRFGRPKVSLLDAEDELTANVQQKSGSRLELTLAGFNLTVAATRPRTTTTDAANFFKLQFRIADADKNQYVDEQEFAALSLPTVGFDSVDSNADGKIYRDELDSFVDRANRAADSQLTATVAKEGRTLFQMLDENRDLRLTRREFLQGHDRLVELDSNRDGKLSESEFQHRYYFSFRTGESPLLPPDAPNSSAAAAQTTPTVRDEATGPLWFQRMDRNRDGDVSQREFLGSPAAFRRLDTNRDKLITAEEAENVGQ